jgi:hypothetical protein
MRATAVFAVGVLLLGAVLAQVADWTVAGVEGDVIAVILMVGGVIGVVSLALREAGRRGSSGGVPDASEQADEIDDRLTAGWDDRRYPRSPGD